LRFHHHHHHYHQISWADKQTAFIAQLVAVHEFFQSVLEQLQRWNINDLLWQQIPGISD